jgi:four helix bundle protein
MATLDKFEDLEAWHLARELTRKIYERSREDEFSRDYALRDQIRRAAISIMSNIAEGFDRGGNKEFKQFLSVAKGSAAEVRSQLYIALDAGYIGATAFQELSDLSSRTGQVIGGLMRYLSRPKVPGPKYR